MFLPENVHKIYKSLKKTVSFDTIDTAVILGSGLGGFENRLRDRLTIPYSDIDGFPQTTVIGHSGTLNFGMIGNKKVMIFAGRFHHYEGHPFERTILPVQLAKSFGVDHLYVSNAAGGINYRFNVGDLMLIDDIMRIGLKYSPNGPVNGFSYYNDVMVQKVANLARELKIYVQRGTYLFAKGPSYETKAEIRAFRTLGADAVGMSTAPELIEARRLGMECLGISLITNMAAGVTPKKLEHAEIKDVAAGRTEDFSRLMEEIIFRL